MILFATAILVLLLGLTLFVGAYSYKLLFVKENYGMKQEHDGTKINRNIRKVLLPLVFVILVLNTIGYINLMISMYGH